MGNRKPSQKETARFSELQYYFDAQQRDFLDRGAIGRKSGEFLALRDKLLALPDAEFEVAMKTLRNLVSTFDSQKKATPDKVSTRETLELQQKPQGSSH